VRQAQHKVNVEGLLVAAGQNLKRWLAATGWGRRDGPSAGMSPPIPVGGLPVPGT